MKRQIVQYLRRAALDNPDDHVMAAIQRLADTVNDMPEPVSRRVKDIAPLIPYGTVTHQIWVCETCKARVNKKDKYCNGCGRKLTAWRDHPSLLDEMDQDEADRTRLEQETANRARLEKDETYRRCP